MCSDFARPGLKEEGKAIGQIGQENTTSEIIAVLYFFISNVFMSIFFLGTL